jgi:alpha-galactosidase
LPVRSLRLRALALAAAGATVMALATGVLPAMTTAAHAEVNGDGLTPLMGWTTWDFVGSDPTKAKVEAQAAALKSSGLLAVGYNYVNIDDFYYECPGRQGPNVDRHGRWVVDPAKFPPSGSTPGLKVVANYVHGLGEKIGFYVTPGISRQAAAKNTPILGTKYTARQIADGKSEHNYNCGGMEGINYSKPGAQAFINSWADELASWGADYVKLDGVGAGDIPDVKAWSEALRQTGRPIHLELSNRLAIGDASIWQKYSNGWRTGGDIACYCGRPFPLTRWSKVRSRFSQVAQWQPFGGPGGFNDYDAIEVGNARNDGITAPERRSQISLWALAASPLVLGSDLTHLNRTDLRDLKDKGVIAVDQDSIDAKRIADRGDLQVFAKTEKDGDVIIGLFNYSGSKTIIGTVSLASAGISGSATARNLWTGKQLGTIAGTYHVTLGPGAVALIKAVPA